MADRLGALLVSAGAGAIATLAGMFVARKMKNMLARPPEMKMGDKRLKLSTRCSWLISELGVEEDFAEGAECLHYTNDNSIEGLHGLPVLSGAEKVDLMFTDYPPEDHPPPTALPLVKWGQSLPDDDDVSETSASACTTNSMCSRIPAVVNNDEYSMIEGAAICMYLADLYGQFLPDPQYKSEYYSWIVYSTATFDSLLRTLQEEIVDTPPSLQDTRIIQSAEHGLHAFLRAMEEALQSRDYLCGSSFTAADCVVGFTLWWAHTIDNGEMLSEHPIICDYLERLKQRPAFQRTFLRKDDEWSWGKMLHAHVRGITN